MSDYTLQQLNTGLLNAIERGNKDEIREFIEDGANINTRNEDGQTPLLIAVNAERYEAVELLLKHGADAALSCTASGNTALHYAANRGNAPLMKLMLGQGIDVNARNMYAQTALHRAAARTELENVELLIGAGADALARDNKNRLPSEIVDLHISTVGAPLSKKIEILTRLKANEEIVYKELCTRDAALKGIDAVRSLPRHKFNLRKPPRP